MSVACSTGHCRRDGTKVPAKEDVQPPTGYTQENLGSIFISKPDGSLQCGMKSGMSLEHMQEQLGSITILSSEKKHDGLMRVQACGATTGMLNVYEIRQQDLSKAQSLGFSPLKPKVKTE